MRKLLLLSVWGIALPASAQEFVELVRPLEEGGKTKVTIVQTMDGPVPLPEPRIERELVSLGGQQVFTHANFKDMAASAMSTLVNGTPKTWQEGGGAYEFSTADIATVLESAAKNPRAAGLHFAASFAIEGNPMSPLASAVDARLSLFNKRYRGEAVSGQEFRSLEALFHLQHLVEHRKIGGDYESMKQQVQKSIDREIIKVDAIVKEIAIKSPHAAAEVSTLVVESIVGMAEKLEMGTRKEMAIRFEEALTRLNPELRADVESTVRVYKTGQPLASKIGRIGIKSGVILSIITVVALGPGIAGTVIGVAIPVVFVAKAWGPIAKGIDRAIVSIRIKSNPRRSNPLREQLKSKCSSYWLQSPPAPAPTG